MASPPVLRNTTPLNTVSDLVARRFPFYYGYLMVPVAILTQVCTSPGQTFAISAFTPALRESLGMPDTQLTGAYMLGTLLAALPLLLIGPMADRYGLRITTGIVATGLAATCWFASRINGFATLLVAFLLLRFLGQGSLSLLSGNTVSMWFQRKLGRVTAVMSAGMAAAFALVPVALLESIDRFGWRETFVALGGIVFVTLVPMVVFIFRNRPEDLGQSVDGWAADAPPHRSQHSTAVVPEREITLRAALRSATFWILAADMVLWAMIGTGLVFYALPIFAERGIPNDQAKTLFTTFAASMLCLQVSGGILADRLRLTRLLALAYLCLVAGAAMVPLATSVRHMHLFALLFGAGQGLSLAVGSTLWVRYYGRRHLGKIRGMVWSMTIAGSGCGPFILGVIQDRTGSFDLGLWAFVALLAPLPLLSLFATPPKASAEEIAAPAAA